MRERGVLNGQERIKERRKVGGRTDKTDRARKMRQTADVCAHACVRKRDKEED